MAEASLGKNQKHNICAYLDQKMRYANTFGDIIGFLKRSRIAYAVSTDYQAYESNQQDFWTHAEIDSSQLPTLIRSSVKGNPVIVSAECIRRLWKFNDKSSDPTNLDASLIKGCFMRMKYDGKFREVPMVKSNLCVPYKYLMHVLVHCLGSRKGGYDEIPEILQSAMVALVLNRPYNFSQMLLSHLIENITRKGNEKFLMYPRFLQKIIDEQVPQL